MTEEREKYIRDLADKFMDDTEVDFQGNGVDAEFIPEEKMEKALKIYDILESFITKNHIENTAQLYESISNSWDAMRALADACDEVGYWYDERRRTDA